MFDLIAASMPASPSSQALYAAAYCASSGLASSARFASKARIVCMNSVSQVVLRSPLSAITSKNSAAGPLEFRS